MNITGTLVVLYCFISNPFLCAFYADVLFDQIQSQCYSSISFLLYFTYLFTFIQSRDEKNLGNERSSHPLKADVSEYVLVLLIFYLLLLQVFYEQFNLSQKNKNKIK